MFFSVKLKSTFHKLGGGVPLLPLAVVSTPSFSEWPQGVLFSKMPAVQLVTSKSLPESRFSGRHCFTYVTGGSLFGFRCAPALVVINGWRLPTTDLRSASPPAPAGRMGRAGVGVHHRKPDRNTFLYSPIRWARKGRLCPTSHFVPSRSHWKVKVASNHSRRVPAQNVPWYLRV